MTPLTCNLYYSISLQNYSYYYNIRLHGLQYIPEELLYSYRLLTLLT